MVVLATKSQETNTKLAFMLPEKLFYGEVKTVCEHLFLPDIRSINKMFNYGYSVRYIAS